MLLKIVKDAFSWNKTSYKATRRAVKRMLSIAMKGRKPIYFAVSEEIDMGECRTGKVRWGMSYQES